MSGALLSYGKLDVSASAAVEKEGRGLWLFSRCLEEVRIVLDSSVLQFPSTAVDRSLKRGE